MKRAEQPTNYVFILAETASEWDSCDFAVLHIDNEWCNLMRKRLALLETFGDDDSFCSLRYWDSPAGFYRKYTDEETDLTEGILNDGEVWCFVDLEQQELQDFPAPENSLGTGTLSLYRHGTAMYSAHGKHTGEEFWAEAIGVEELLNAYQTNPYANLKNF